MPFRKLLWLFPAAVTIHNSEEALTMPSWIAANPSHLPIHPSTTAIETGLLCVTLAAFLSTSLSAKQSEESIWSYLLFGGITTMLLNVFIPHLPATIYFHSYPPGVITAVAINLPLMSFLFLQALRNHWVTGIKAAFYALLVPIATAAAIAFTFTHI